MALSQRLDARNLGLIAIGLAISLLIGVGAGIQPAYGLAAALGLAFAAATVANLTVGVFLFTLLSFVEVLGSGNGVLSFLKVAGVIVFLSWFAAQAVRSRAHDATRPPLSSSPALSAGVIALVGWSAMSSAWAITTGSVFATTFRLLLDVLLFPIMFGAIRRKEHAVSIVGAFVLGAVISALIGLLQSSGARLAGGIGDADNEAALLVAALALTIGLIATLPRGSGGRTLAWIGALIMGVGLLDTGSRGGVVGLGVMLVAAFLFGGRWRGRAGVGALTVAVLAVFYVVALAPPAATQHLNSNSSTGRTDLWKIGIKMWEANPVVGVGAGNFARASVDYVQTSGPLTRADIIVDNPRVTHNTFLEILDELGVPGLIAFLTIVIASVSAALRAARLYERVGDTAFELLCRSLALALIGLLTSDFFISTEYEHLLWLLLAVPPALLAVARSETRTRLR
jgi:putative inorganic carbon (hco3(-)) transporter